MTKGTIAYLLDKEKPTSLEIINILDDYVRQGASIGTGFVEVFRKGVKFSDRHKTRVRNSLIKGMTAMAESGQLNEVCCFAAALAALKNPYGRILLPNKPFA